MTEILFKKTIGYLQEMFNCDMSEQKIIMYWETLKELSDEDFSNSVKRILKNYKYTKFPLPAVFFEYAKQPDDNIDISAHKAILAVKKAVESVGKHKSVQFEDMAIHSAIRRFGGWVEMCGWEQNDWNINEGRFLAAYKAAKMSGEGTDIPRLSGIADTYNNAHALEHDEAINFISKNGKLLNGNDIRNLSGVGGDIKNLPGEAQREIEI